jgi:hypothetical protein
MAWVVRKRQDILELDEVERLRREMGVAPVTTLKIQHGMVDTRVPRLPDLLQIVIYTKDGNIVRNILSEIERR